MKLISFLKRQSKVLILSLAIAIYVFYFIQKIGEMGAGSTNAVFESLLLLGVVGVLLAVMAFSLFSKRRELKRITLAVFASFYAVMTLLASGEPFNNFARGASAVMILNGVFSLFLVLAFLAFAVFYLLGLLFPKVKFNGNVIFIILLSWLGLNSLVFIFDLVLLTQLSAGWFSYFAIMIQRLLLPILFFVAFYASEAMELISREAASKEKSEEAKTSKKKKSE